MRALLVLVLLACSFGADAQLTRTDVQQTTSANPFGTGAYTPASFDPCDGCLIVVKAAFIATADDASEGTTLTITDNTGGGPLGWTSITATTTSPAWSYGIRAWQVQVGAQGSMTVSIDAGATSVEVYHVSVQTFSGYDTADPVGGTGIGSDADGDGAATCTLSESPVSTSEVFGHLFNGLASGTGTATQGADFTELYDATVGGWAIFEGEVDETPTDTSVEWADIAATGSVFGGANFLCFEVHELGGVLDQFGFRWGVDDNNEASHTFEAAENTDITIADNQSRLLRIGVEATTGDPGATAYTLRYQKNGSGGYVAVPVGSTSEPTPVIESGDATVTTIGTAADPWAINQPTGSTGDLMLFVLCWDDSTDTTSVAAPSGPNGETLTSIVGPQASNGTEVRIQAWRTVATGTWSTGTLSFNPSATETVRAVAVRVPAGEFDGTTAVGASGSASSAGTAESNVNSPAFSAGGTDGNGRLLLAFCSDADAITPPASGTDTVNNATGGGVGLDIEVRETAVADSESIASITATIASDSWATLAFVVRAPTVNNEVYITTSANIAAGGEATTARLTDPGNDFVTGRRWDDENGTDTIDITDADYSEFEWNVFIASSAANDDFFDFRAYAGTTALNTYTDTPRWTIPGAGGGMMLMRRRRL